MANTYDRVDWKFLIKMYEKRNFNNIEVDKMSRLVENKLYSILINGLKLINFKRPYLSEYEVLGGP